MDGRLVLPPVTTLSGVRLPSAAVTRPFLQGALHCLSVCLSQTLFLMDGQLVLPPVTTLSGVWLRSAEVARPLLCVRRQWLELRQELRQVSRHIVE